jgi:membrane protease YdiL (CAAX protease family)
MIDGKRKPSAISYVWFLVILLIYHFLVPFLVRIIFTRIGFASSPLAELILAGLWFGFQAVFLLLITPCVFGLPNGRESIRDYLQSIRLSNIRPVFRNLMFGIFPFIIYGLSFLPVALITGFCILDMAGILPPASWSLLKSINYAIWEEILFRGILLTMLLRNFSDRQGLLISSMIFGLSHSIQLLYGTNTLFVVVLVISIILGNGLVFGYLFLKTQSLLPSILLHYLFNTMFMVCIYNSGAPFPLYLLFVSLTAYIIPSLIVLKLIDFLVTKWH